LLLALRRPTLFVAFLKRELKLPALWPNALWLDLSVPTRVSEHDCMLLDRQLLLFS
jgi:hypothetical protein